MKRRILLCALAGVFPVIVQAQAAAPDVAGGWLVTAQEAVQYGGAEGFDMPRPLRARAVVPLIEILQPQAALDGAKVKAPFPIAIRFKAREDAPIVPTTFKVLYGAFGIDITSRITKYAQATAEGLSFDKAQIPPGKHRLVLQVQDEKQRTAERELRFEVE